MTFDQETASAVNLVIALIALSFGLVSFVALTRLFDIARMLRDVLKELRVANGIRLPCERGGEGPRINPDQPRI